MVASGHSVEIQKRKNTRVDRQKMKIHTVRCASRSVEIQKRENTRVDRQKMKIHTVPCTSHSVEIQKRKKTRVDRQMMKIHTMGEALKQRSSQRSMPEGSVQKDQSAADVRTKRERRRFCTEDRRPMPEGSVQTRRRAPFARSYG